MTNTERLALARLVEAAYEASQDARQAIADDIAHNVSETEISS